PETMLPIVERIRDAVDCHVAALPVTYRTTPAEPTFQSLRDADGTRVFPLALDPFLSTRFELADFAVRARAAGVSYVGVCCGGARGNTGWVCPSFTYPLPAPGMVREGLRQLVTGGEAFVLRPSLDPSFVRWLWSFRRSCSQPRFDAGVRALLGLNRRTLELFDAYRAAGVSFEMHEAGMVIAARSHE